MHLEQLRKHEFLSIGAITMFLFPFGTFFQSLGMVVFCIQLLYFILIVKRQKPITRHNFDTTLFLFCIPFVVYCCYAPWAYDKNDAYEYLLRTVPILIFPLAILWSRIKPNGILLKRNFVLGTLLSIFASLFLALIGSFENQVFSMQNFMYYALAGNMSMHPTYYSLIIITAVVFIGNSSLGITHKQRFLLLLIFTVALLLLQVRIVLLSYVILIFVKAISIMRKDRKMAYIIFVLLPAMAVMLIFSSSRYRELLTSDSINQLGTSKENGIVQRIWLWNSTIEAIEDKPLFGYGLRSQRAMFHKLVHKRALSQDHKRSTYEAMLENSKKNAHSQYLQWLFDFGILGFTLIMLSIVLLIIQASKPGNISFLLLLLPFTFIMLTENLLDRQVGIYYWSFILPLSKVWCDD